MGRCTHTPVLRSLPPAELSDGGYDTKNHLRNARMMDEAIFQKNGLTYFLEFCTRRTVREGGLLRGGRRCGIIHLVLTNKNKGGLYGCCAHH